MVQEAFVQYGVPTLAILVRRELEIRQLFELEDFGPSEAIDRARELEKQLGGPW